jgi:hypothetical protein
LKIVSVEGGGATAIGVPTRVAALFVRAA